MSRQSSSSSSSSSNVKQGPLGDVAACCIVLESLVDELDQNSIDLDPTLTKQWKAKLLDLTKEAAVILHQQSENKKILSELQNKQLIITQSDNMNERLTEVTEIFKKRVQNYNPETSTTFKKIKAKISGGDDDDDIIVNDAYTENDFKCPITGKLMTEPMQQ